MPIKSIKSLHAVSRLLVTIMFLIVSGAVDSTESTTKTSIRIAVASNFLETSQLLANDFEKNSGVSVQISSGSSGKLYHQIMYGAPFDVFLSADKEKPQQLITKQKAISSSLTTYARGQLVLWLKNCQHNSDLQSLKQPAIKKIAIANPKLAPYGASAQALLETNNLLPEIKNKLVYPENIAQVAQLATLKLVDAALIAQTHAKILFSPPNNLSSNTRTQQPSCIISLSDYRYPAIEQQLVRLKSSRQPELAKRFIDYLQSPSGQALIKSMGYLIN